LKPISATRQSQPEIMPAKKTLPNEKAENLKTWLLKKYWPKLLTWKEPPLKLNLPYKLKTAMLKNKLANQRRIWFCSCFCSCSWATQRFALPACGRAWTMLGSRKNSKPEKCL
jgi:hypothetical protein